MKMFQGVKTPSGTVEIVYGFTLPPGRLVRLTSIKWRYVRSVWWKPWTWSSRWHIVLADAEAAKAARSP